MQLRVNPPIALICDPIDSDLDRRFHDARLVAGYALGPGDGPHSVPSLKNIVPMVVFVLSCCAALEVAIQAAVVRDGELGPDDHRDRPVVARRHRDRRGGELRARFGQCLGVVVEPGRLLLWRQVGRASLGCCLARLPMSRARTSPMAGPRLAGSGSGRCAWIW